MKDKEHTTHIISLEFQFGNLELTQIDDKTGGVLSVRTKFLDYPSIEINEDDFCNSCPAGEARFEKAKHMMIPLKDEDLKHLKNHFTINIKVMKTSIQEELLPVMEQVGYTCVNIGRTFASLLSNVNTKPTKECPSVKVLSDQLEVINASTGSIIGTMNVYIRLKSFGNCIVTGMQELMVNKTNVFNQCFSENDVVADDDDDDDHDDDDNDGDGDKEDGDDDDDDGDIEDVDGEEDNEPNDEDAAVPGIKHKTKVIKPSKHPGKHEDKLRLFEGVFNMDDVADNIQDPNNELGGADSKIIQNATPSQRKKAATGQPADDQTVKMIPILDHVPKNYQGPLSGQPVNSRTNVYGLYVAKKNDKKKMFSRIHMEVRMPKAISRSKERYTKTVQCVPK